MRKEILREKERNLKPVLSQLFVYVCARVSL